ncbi:MAG: tRNA (adenosine(37)-N6)-dimethylallyltransferase MiaA [Janthinobacterium lividum]
MGAASHEAGQAGQGGDVLPPCLIVCGPTASGKSALALGLAERLGGVVINADSMQVYRELRVLTARPSDADEARVPHRLYGVRAAAEPGSAAWWRSAALVAMGEATAVGRLPILCGGTGLYLAALTEGLAEIPEPGEAARAEARALVAAEGSAALHARLALVDPDTAARLRPGDPQRVTRAWEVWRGTGRGMAAWHAGPASGAAPYAFTVLRLDPPREALRAAIAARFAGMLAAGALGEVRALLASGADPAVPALRAHGVPELSAVLRGEATLAGAEAAAVAATLRYTKRQRTWFGARRMAEEGRTRVIDACVRDLAQFSERSMADMLNFVCQVG